MKNTSSNRLVVFASTLLFFFFICPFFWDVVCVPFPLLHSADFFELASPFFVVSAYLLLLETRTRARLSLIPSLLAVFFLVLLVLGTGIHLAGNSIQHLLEATPTPGLKETAAYRLAYFYHKPVGHYTQSIALMGLSSLLVLFPNPISSAEKRNGFLESLASVFYGFIFFCFHVSGKIAPLAIAYSLALLFWAYRERTSVREKPVLLFFTRAHCLFLALCLIWAFRWRGLPSFTETGIIN